MPADSLLSRVRHRLRGTGVGATLVRGATGAAGAHVSGVVLALLAQLVLARLLDVSHYGYYVYAFTWTIILAELCRLGFQNSLIRFTSSYRTDEAWASLHGIIRRGGQIVLISAIVTGALLAAVTLILAERLPGAQVATFLVAAVAVVPVALLGVTQGILQGHRRPAQAMLPFRTLLHAGTLVLALAAATTTGLDTAPQAMVLTLLAAVASLAIAVVWARTALDPAVGMTAPDYQTRFWLRASLPLLLMSGMQLLMKHTDTVMLGALASTDEAGFYFPAARMATLASLGLLSANAIVAPMVSELYTRGDRAGLQRLLTFAAIGTSAVTLAATAAFWLLGAWALGLFGEAFRGAYPALMILLAGQVVNALSGPVALVMTMTGHQDRASLVLVCAALLNVTLNAILIPYFGLLGAAIATAISMIFWNLWMLVEVFRRHRVNPSIFGRWPSLSA